MGRTLASKPASTASPNIAPLPVRRSNSPLLLPLPTASRKTCGRVHLRFAAHPQQGSGPDRQAVGRPRPRQIRALGASGLIAKRSGGRELPGQGGEASCRTTHSGLHEATVERSRPPGGQGRWRACLVLALLFSRSSPVSCLLPMPRLSMGTPVVISTAFWPLSRSGDRCA